MPSMYLSKPQPQQPVMQTTVVVGSKHTSFVIRDLFLIGIPRVCCIVFLGSLGKVWVGHIEVSSCFVGKRHYPTCDIPINCSQLYFVQSPSGRLFLLYVIGQPQC